MTESGLADYIRKHLPQNDTPLRLNSCSDLESAKLFSKEFPNREVYATNAIVNIHPDGGITTVARSGNDTQQWRKLKNGEDVGNAPTPKAPEGDAIGKYVKLGVVKFTGNEVQSSVNQVLDRCNVEMKAILDDALTHNSPLYNKLNNITVDGSHWFTVEEISYEMFEYIKISKNMDTKQFSNYCEGVLDAIPQAVQKRAFSRSFRCWRYVATLKPSVSSNNPINNISLGLAGTVSAYDATFKSISYKSFYERGFCMDVIPSGGGTIPKNQWFPQVCDAIYKSYINGGTIYYHLDGLTDLNALYNAANPLFESSGTLLELRYLIDKGIVDKGRVAFKLDGQNLPTNIANELQDAILEWKKKVQNGLRLAYDDYKYL